MADYKVTDTELTSVADAIRTKGGTSAQLEWPAEFVSAISAISGGGSTLGTKTITQNGTYNASDDSLDGYSSVTVNVSGGLDTADFIIEGQTGSYYNSTASLVRIYGFMQHGGVTGVEMPSCTNIGDNAFQYCSALTTASFPACTNIGNTAFQNCYALTTVSFPACTNIGVNAFMSCRSLETALFPACTNIGNYAFRNCSALTSLYLLGSSVCALGKSVFLTTPMSLSTYTGNFGSIYVPSSLYDSYINATNWSEYSARIVSIAE